MPPRSLAVLILSLLVLAMMLLFAPNNALARPDRFLVRPLLQTAQPTLNGTPPQLVPTLNGTPPAVFTPGPFTPFPTNTPQADGSIVHEVQPGEALWSIAISYGTTIEEILSLNGLPPGSTALFAGQQLLIRMGTPGLQETLDAQATLGTPLPAVTEEGEASPLPTETRRPTSTRPPTGTPRPTRTQAPEPSATLAPAARPDWLPENRTLGMVLVGVGVVGLLVVLVAGFRR
jgi:LysM repeat protein